MTGGLADRRLGRKLSTECLSVRRRRRSNREDETTKLLLRGVASDDEGAPRRRRRRRLRRRRLCAGANALRTDGATLRSSPASVRNSRFEICLKYVRKKTRRSKPAEPAAPMRIRDEIYRQPPPSIKTRARRNPGAPCSSVDGAKAPVYCQNLCLLSKLFPVSQDAVLRRRALPGRLRPHQRDVPTAEAAGAGSGARVGIEPPTDAPRRIVGYFSKHHPVREWSANRRALTLPPYQRKGYGTFQMRFRT